MSAETVSGGSDQPLFHRAEFADPQREAAFRSANLTDDTRSIRRHLLGIIIIYLTIIPVDFNYVPRETALYLFFPLRCGVLLTCLTLILLPARSWRLREYGTVFLFAYIWVVAMMSPLWIHTRTVGIVVGFYLFTFLLIMHLFTPARWLHTLIFGIVASFAYLALLIFVGTVPAHIVVTATALFIANMTGAGGALRMARLRRLAVVRQEEIEAEKRLLEAATTQLAAEERLIAEQRDHLATQLQQLMDSQEQLQQAQARLVQAEKMSLLSRLVSGVAGELSLPVRDAATAASQADRQIAILESGFAGGGLKKSEMLAIMATVTDDVQCITRSLRRSAELVQGFKQVAVDQAGGEPRPFELSGYLQDVLISMGPLLQQAGVSVQVDCPSGLWLETRPGALSQIVSNLVLNAVDHAFPGRSGGTVRIQVPVSNQDGQPDLVVIDVSDDGVGLPALLLADPFKPTMLEGPAVDGRPGKARLVLGLHVVHKLATETLGGEAQLLPSATGTAFRIIFPRILPNTAAAA
jgi:signal transduction histidine kinase